jgi:4-amino-4-deoxy-L-arabinose transferase-like glycosyltransferase
MIKEGPVYLPELWVCGMEMTTSDQFNQGTPSQTRMSGLTKILWLAIMLLALLVRFPNLKAAYPYINYIDEGAIMKGVVSLLQRNDWDPGVYLYPSLPFYSVAAAARVYAPFHKPLTGTDFSQALSNSSSKYYDILEPPQLLIVGRAMTLIFALGVVFMTGLLARKIAGEAAGLLAAFLAALLPALIIRSTIVAVDTYAAFFAVTCIFFVSAAPVSRKPMIGWMGAGAMAGLAFTSKYTAALVFLAVVAGVLLWKVGWRKKSRALALGAATAALAAMATMPALWLRTGKVISHVQFQQQIYSSWSEGSYWDQAIRRAEWDQPLEYPELGITYLAIAAVGLVMAARDKRYAHTVAAWSLFIIVSLAIFGSRPYQPFRNLLPMVPLTCVLAAIPVSMLRDRIKLKYPLDALAVVVFAALFALPVYAYASSRLRLADSRVEAINWLEANADKNAIFAGSEEIAFLPSETECLGSRFFTIPASYLDSGVSPSAHYFAFARIEYTDKQSGQRRQFLPTLQGFEAQKQFGEGTTDINPGNWRGNRQGILIYKRSLIR